MARRNGQPLSFRRSLTHESRCHGAHIRSYRGLSWWTRTSSCWLVSTFTPGSRAMRDLDVRQSGPRRTILFCCTLATLTIVPAPAVAQWGTTVAQADSLLASGHVSTAESVYYATSSARPRDAVARAALGRYLAARGALRIGAELLEEARLFGGDSASIARSLAPIYGSLGDYRALAVLPASPPSPPEQSRTRWLFTHSPMLEFPDSAARLPYKPITDGSGIGTPSIPTGHPAADAAAAPTLP